MDEQFEKLDVDAVLRPTIIKASTVWSKTSQAALLAEATTVSVHADEQEHAKELQERMDVPVQLLPTHPKAPHHRVEQGL
eukprot:6445824-Amphidinium_carterae.1